MLSTEIVRETSYNSEELAVFLEENEHRMVPDQKTAFSVIMNNLEHGTGGLFFLDAPGGTGKTFVTNLLLVKVRQKKDIALAVASSGIAATLLDGGRTSHSAFKLPLVLSRQETPTCNISKGSAKAKVLERCKLIVWDEATMSNKKAYEAVDRTLQDIRGNSSIMGGVTVVLSGHFRQTLPVVPKGTRVDQVNACIKSSHLWQRTEKLSLSTNMRVHLHGDEAAAEFSAQLLQVGNGEIPPSTQDLQIKLPFGNMVDTEEDLISNVFPDLDQHVQEKAWLCERAILAPKNEVVNQMNRKLLYVQPGNSVRY